MKHSVVIVMFSAFVVAGALYFEPIVSRDFTALREGAVSQIDTLATKLPSNSIIPIPTHSTSPSVSPASTKTPNSGIALVSLNFDDGYESTYNNGISVLNALGLKSTQYIITQKFGDKTYVTPEQVLDMQAHGHEIGAHTRTHPHLSELSETEAKNEILGSKQELLSIGVREVTTFAYPYGDYNQMSASVARSGFSTVRTTHPGFDDANSDRYALVQYPVNADTNFDTVQSLIDTAVREKKWLILLFHRVDEAGNPISTTHQEILQIGQYLTSHHVPVVTMKEGARITFGK